MRLRILSDLHLEFEDWTPPSVEADIVVLAGDINKRNRAVPWIVRHFPDVPVVYIAGNHEFYGSSISGVLGKIRESVSGRSIHFLENQSVEIQGVIFLGCTLWTDFRLHGSPSSAGPEIARRMNDYRCIRVTPAYRRLNGRDSTAIHMESRSWLEQSLERIGDRRAVVISHHAPSARSLEPGFATDVLSGAYASPLDELVANSKIAAWIHGHTHRSVDYRIGTTRVVSNQKGYPDQTGTGFDPALVIEI